MTPATPVVALLEEAAQTAFYGSLQIEFQAGKPVLVRKTQTFKPEDATEDSRSPHECRRYSKRGPEDVHS